MSLKYLPLKYREVFKAHRHLGPVQDASGVDVFDAQDKASSSSLLSLQVLEGP